MTYADRRFRYRESGLWNSPNKSHPPGGGASAWQRAQVNPSVNRGRASRPAVGDWRTEGRAPDAQSQGYGWQFRGGVNRSRGVRRPGPMPERAQGLYQGRPALSERRARGDLSGRSEWDYGDEGAGYSTGARRTSANFRDYGARSGREGGRGGQARYGREHMQSGEWRPAPRPHRGGQEGGRGYGREFGGGTMWRHPDVWGADARQERGARRHRGWDRGSADWEQASPFS